MIEKKPAYLGVDCGSVGIKLALMDEDSQVIDTSYHKNRGIFPTVKKCLEDLAVNSENYEVKSVGTTGSGRKLSSYLVGADCVKTEILAHTIATLNFYPDVKTILDIGGEDCKIMTVNEGILEHFKMNSICGAGTGSIIENIAGRMNVEIEDVGDMALNYDERLDFPGKCGVFCQSAVVSCVNSGKEKKDILRGVVRALVNNYLMLGRGISLEPPFVYQGATAQNKAIVKELEEQLGNEVIVPEHAPVMGAIGAALLAKDYAPEKTNFKGFNLSEIDFKTKTLKAKGCDNNCEITYLYEGKDFVGSVGNRCESCIPS